MPVSNRMIHKPAPSIDPSKPYWRSECGRATVYVGDMLKVTQYIDPEQFHAVVTDPPYDLLQGGINLRSMKYNGNRTEPTQQDNYKAGGFMGLRWDGTGVAFDPNTWQQILRVSKPGAHLLSFGGTRTYHRMVCAIEDAGWEIRDAIMWVYGQGFPKSHNISKAIDKMLGAEREKIRTPMSPDSNVWMDKIGAHRPWKEQAKEVGYHEHDGPVAVTPEAQQWDGWGTSLKPAVEPCVIARKSLIGPVAHNVIEHGCGGLNIDGCLVGTDGGGRTIEGSEPGYLNNVYGVGMGGNPKDPNYVGGRWPANLIHDGSDEVVDLFPHTTSSSFTRALPKRPGDSRGADHGQYDGPPTHRGHDDSGSAARFFYTAKAGAKDRPHGKGSTIHPTVKPLDLMQYLVRLVCAPGGVVLDPFMGSGSTGCAAIAEGMRFVGIEQSEEYADIAVGRLKLALAEYPLVGEVPIPGRTPQVVEETGTVPVARRLRR